MDVQLHPHQIDIFEDPHRYKVVAAGRRFGKSYLAAVTLFVEAAKNSKIRTDGVEIDLLLEEVYYVAPTFEQGKKILWPLLRKLGEGLIEAKHENIGTLTLINGRRISIKGADNPDSLRGVGLSYVVMDEYAFMKEEVWEIVSPSLSLSEGGALFIGTPDGKNHFYELWVKGLQDDPEWKSWSHKSIDNPFLPRAEIARAESRMSAERFRQEMEASFEASGGMVLSSNMFPIVDTIPYPNDMYVAIDLAGFKPTEAGRKISRLDDHAIAVVAVHAGGWCIVDILHGKWDTRETSLRIVKAFRDYKPRKLGIEKGIAKDAVQPYMDDEMNRLKTYFTIEPLTHGNQRKTDRITWALQGRAEKGRIQLLRGGWNKVFLQQAVDFPSTLSHDDLLDAVAYIDQLADPWMEHFMDVEDTWAPLDDLAGY